MTLPVSETSDKRRAEKLVTTSKSLKQLKALHHEQQYSLLFVKMK
jgi:hypothetical protein